MLDVRPTRIASLDNLRVDGYPAQERNVHLPGHVFTAAGLKYIRSLTTLWADKTAHILQHAYDRQAQVAAEGDPFSDIR